MAELENELKTLAQRMMSEKWEYKAQTKKYVRQVMGYYTQEKIMEYLDGLNYKELKMITGCGVPGDAWRYAVDLLRKKKQEIELFITQSGQKATSTVELDQDEEDITNGSTRI
jgi:hypothetical protein